MESKGGKERPLPVAPESGLLTVNDDGERTEETDLDAHGASVSTKP